MILAFLALVSCKKVNPPPAPLVPAFDTLSLYQNGRGMHLAADIVTRFGYNLPEPATEADSLSRADDFARLAKMWGAFGPTRDEDRDAFIRDEWGLVLEAGEERVRGLIDATEPSDTPGDDVHVGVLGCATCHTGRVAGITVRGLGNKNVDVWRTAEDARLVQELVTRLRKKGGFRYLLDLHPPGERIDRLDARALAFSARLSDKNWANRVAGLVSDSMILWWFYEQDPEGRGSMPAEAPRGEVKVPALWNLDKTRGCTPENTEVCERGLFVDGFGVGRSWLAGAELGGDPDPDSVTTKAYQARVDGLAKTIAASSLVPPPYIDCVDEERVASGKILFEGKAFACAECHGSTETVGPPEMIEIDHVGTDPARLHLLATDVGSSYPGFAAESRRRIDSMAQKTPRLQRARWKDESGATAVGYYAPRLEGIWARFPYLHNGSVPTIRDLLTPPEERPRVFDLARAGEKDGFDPQDLGLVVPPGASERLADAVASRQAGGFPTEHRQVYVTSPTDQTGHSNRGHWMNSWPKDSAGRVTTADQDALIEYLKTIGTPASALRSCP